METSGKTKTPVSEGYTVNLGFTVDSFLRKYRNNELQFSKHFYLLNNLNIYGEESREIIFNDHISYLFTFDGNNTLYLEEVYYDCYKNKYTRE